MDGNATLILAEAKNAITIPLDAVQEKDNGQKFVYTQDSSNNISEKTIKTGIENDTDVQVIEGLTENDQVVIKQK